jgi:hypothetical protein
VCFAIFVRKGEEQFAAVNTVPEQLRTRQLAVRAFDPNGMMLGHELVHGEPLEESIERLFDKVGVAYLHISSRRSEHARMLAVPRDGHDGRGSSMCRRMCTSSVFTLSTDCLSLLQEWHLM